MKTKFTMVRKIVVIVLAVALYFGNQYLGGESTSGDPSQHTQTGGQQHQPNGDRDDVELIAQSFKAKKSDVWVQSGGEVTRVLADDNEGSRHQRFLVRLPNGQTVLIAHNIDLAPKIPLSRGDQVEFRGEYEWNDRGGVVHWTHHDPQGRKPGGWISHQRQKYE